MDEEAIETWFGVRRGEEENLPFEGITAVNSIVLSKSV